LTCATIKPIKTNEGKLSGKRFDLADEIINPERLGEVVPCPRVDGFRLAFRVVLGADDDDGNVGEFGIVVQKFAQLEARQPWHHQIQCDQIGVHGVRHLDGFCAVVDSRWLVTLHGDQRFH